jgi:hypothetical protein
VRVGASKLDSKNNHPKRITMFNYYRMSSVFRRAAFAFLTAIGLTYARQTTPQKIHELFRRLWPQSIGVDLLKCGEYLIPTDIGVIDAVFSPGVGPNSEFELFFASKNIPCYMADASVDAPSVSNSNFHFVKKYIGATTQGEFINLEDWIHQNYPEGQNAVLQMDIEGAEYESILSVSSETLKRFKLIVMEIHYLNFLASQEGMALGSAFFHHLLKDFTVAHFHVNNFLRPVKFKDVMFPADIEITLVRNDLVKNPQPVEVLPHPLDMKNNPNKRDHQFHQYFRDGVVARY